VNKETNSSKSTLKVAKKTKFMPIAILVIAIVGVAAFSVFAWYYLTPLMIPSDFSKLKQDFPELTTSDFSKLKQEFPEATMPDFSNLKVDYPELTIPDLYNLKVDYPELTIPDFSKFD
jgi:hypothetical protein